MTHKDLQIGDYVYHKGKIVKVDILSSRDLNLGVADNNGSNTALYKDIEPIPITPEILEQNGFTKESFVSSTHYYCNYNESHIRAFKLYGEDYAYVDAIEPHMHSAPFISCAMFKYVHELQQALRLCKINKEIKL